MARRGEPKIFNSSVSLAASHLDRPAADGKGHGTFRGGSPPGDRGLGRLGPLTMVATECESANSRPRAGITGHPVSRPPPSLLPLPAPGSRLPCQRMVQLSRPVDWQRAPYLPHTSPV